MPLTTLAAPAAALGAPGSGIASPTGLDDVPPEARQAYELAETVLAASPAGCHVPWTVLAAAAAVASAHGESPYGDRLDGLDTDGGRVDGERGWDRPVGPFRFLPTTWSVVAIDGDADGRRDPLDPDDAALAYGVLLCSSEPDLGTTDGLRGALRAVYPVGRFPYRVIRTERGLRAELAALPERPTMPVVVRHEPPPGVLDEPDGPEPDEERETDDPHVDRNPEHGDASAVALD